jgi:hypothetical protein
MFTIRIVPEVVPAAWEHKPYRVERRKQGRGGEPLIRIHRFAGRHGFTCSAWYTDWDRPFAGERLGAC